MKECLACDLAAGRALLPGGVIHAEAGWVVEHCVGALGVGTLIVKPERHVVHVAELTPGEASAMGALIHRATRVVSELCQPEQVYVNLWSHAGGMPGHIHYVIQPVQAADMARFESHGPKLQVAMFAAGTRPDADTVEAFAHKARALWRRAPSGAGGPLDYLLVLETRLLSPPTRYNREEIGPLLADSFIEIGSSGRTYNKAEILAELAAEEQLPVPSGGMEVRELAPGVGQVTYRTKSNDAEAYRSSIWVHGADGWQMVFHQGTRLPA